jgi:hypothetical protein
MALEMCFCKIDVAEFEALRADPTAAQRLVATKEFATGPNHRNIQMFHYILTGTTRDAEPGIANVFADHRASDAIDFPENIVAVTPAALPKLAALLSSVDVETVARRWGEFCVASGSDANPDDGDYFFEVLNDLAAYCDDAIANQQTVLWTWG